MFHKLSARVCRLSLIYALKENSNADATVVPFFVLAGDVDHSRSVNLDDFTALAANFGLTGRIFSQGDLSYDGSVNLDDFTILAAAFGTSFEVRLFLTA